MFLFICSYPYKLLLKLSYVQFTDQTACVRTEVLLNYPTLVNNHFLLRIAFCCLWRKQFCFK